MKTLILILLVTFCVVSCTSGQPKYHPGGPYFYKSWASYYLPYRPINEITENEAKELEQQGYSFYIAYFNEQGYIKSFEKKYKGNQEFKTDYSYENGILMKEESIQGGKITTTLYDKNGKIIKP